MTVLLSVKHGNIVTTEFLLGYDLPNFQMPLRRRYLNYPKPTSSLVLVLDERSRDNDSSNNNNTGCSAEKHCPFTKASTSFVSLTGNPPSARRLAVLRDALARMSGLPRARRARIREARSREHMCITSEHGTSDRCSGRRETERGRAARGRPRSAGLVGGTKRSHPLVG